MRLYHIYGHNLENMSFSTKYIKKPELPESLAQRQARRGFNSNFRAGNPENSVGGKVASLALAKQASEIDGDLSTAQRAVTTLELKMCATK